MQFMTLGGHRDTSFNEGRDGAALVEDIRGWGRELGFDALRIGRTDLPGAAEGLAAWLAEGCHGEMDYMARHGDLRSRPEALLPGAVRVISARMNYLSPAEAPETVLADPSRAYLSRYALGRDYHKVLRQRLKRLAERIAQSFPHAWRVCTDSAPVLEVALGERSGLGWRGKHTLLLDRDAGSMFFLGEILTSLALPVDPPVDAHCGRCRSCIDACPTGAIVEPFRVDARRCISYLTIELKGAIPVELRPMIGNRVYGCDDCQIVCPWNRFAQLSPVADFNVRHGLDGATLCELFSWSRADFDERLAGSPIHRIGHERWRRNLAVGIGNGPVSAEAQAALGGAMEDASPLVREHVHWAMDRLDGQVES